MVDNPLSDRHSYWPQAQENGTLAWEPTEWACDGTQKAHGPGLAFYLQNDDVPDGMMEIRSIYSDPVRGERVSGLRFVRRTLSAMEGVL